MKRSRPISKHYLGAIVLLAHVGCSASTSNQSPVSPQAPIEPPPEESSPVEQADPPTPPAQKVVILSDVGFATPESVYFDRHRDVYLVSNINGSPTDKDHNGFISRLVPQNDGQYKIDLKFIDGSKPNTRLDAPKGITVIGDTMYVADIDRVRKFSAVTGSSLGEIELEGSTFINDIATGVGGVLYVSDSGLTPQFEPSGTDAIYRIGADEKPRKLVSGTDLGGPNGLIATEGGVWAATFRSGELYWISDKGKKSAVQKLPHGQNDGIIFDQAGQLVVSSWEESAVLAGAPEGDFKVIVSGVTSPADIGYDCSRDRLLIPLFKEDKVVIQQMGD